MTSKMTPQRKRGRLMISLALTAVSLAACTKRADQITANPAEPVVAPPLAALPLATAQAPELAAAPEASQLPWPQQRIRTAQRPRYDRYGYIDAAYDMGYAFADTPPDYTVDYEGIDPWIWRSGDGAYRIVEWLPYGERDYYYAPGDSYPFFVSDPYYSYAYEDDVLVGLFDPYGYAIDYGYDDPRLYDATRYYGRAGDLYHAAIYSSRRSAYAEDWLSHRDFLSDRSRRWEQQQQRDPDWQRWRARNERDEQRQWRPEREQRLHYAAASAAGIGAVRERMQRDHGDQLAQQRFASFSDRGGRELRGQPQQFQQRWQSDRRRDGGPNFRPDQMNRQAFDGRNGRLASNSFFQQRRAASGQAGEGRQNRFAGSGVFEQRRAERQAQGRSFGMEGMRRQEMAGQQGQRRFADRGFFQQRQAGQEQQRGWRNREQAFGMQQMRQRAEASRAADSGRQRQIFEGRRNDEQATRALFDGRQHAQPDMMARFQQREAGRGFAMQQRQQQQQHDNQARAWQGMQQRMAQHQERAQFHQVQQPQQHQDTAQRFAQAGGGRGGGGHWGGGGGGQGGGHHGRHD